MTHARTSTSAAAALTKEDKYYLRENFFLAVDLGPDDPQAQRVYTVEDNVIDPQAPIWSSSEVEAHVRSFSQENELRVRLCWSKQIGGCAYVGRGGGVIQLQESRNSGEFRPVLHGQHLASRVLHELAHILTPHIWRRPKKYNTREFQSHGPEFVRCYLTLLAAHMDTAKAKAAFRYMGIAISLASKVPKPEAGATTPARKR